MTTQQHIEALNHKVTMNIELIAQTWNEDYTTINEYFNNLVDKFNLKPYNQLIKELYIETEKTVNEL